MYCKSKLFNALILAACFEFFHFSATSYAATDFFLILQGTSTEIHCDFLSIDNEKASCKENNTLAVYDFNSINKLIVLKDGKTFQFDKEIKNNSSELEAAINTVNKQKIRQFIAAERQRQREIAQREERKRKEREKSAEYFRKYHACKGLYDEQCQGECATNKYQYSKSCYNICIKTNCL